MLEQNKWYDFADFKRVLHERCQSIDSAAYFCDPKNKWLREAWIAGEFGQHMRVARIRLASESDWPDFEVKLRDGSGLRCEAVEADRPSRKRGDEYRTSKNQGYPIEHVSQGELLVECQYIQAALTAVVRRKLDNLYPENAAALVIYLNIGWGDRRAEIEPVIATNTQKGLQRFNSVWTLWSGRLYRTWSDGLLSIESPKSADGAQQVR